MNDMTHDQFSFHQKQKHVFSGTAFVRILHCC